MDKNTFFAQTKNRIFQSGFGRLFLDTKFVNYTWIGVFVSGLNIFLLWLLIDIFKISTIIASTVVIGGTFVLRYILLLFFKVL